MSRSGRLYVGGAYAGHLLCFDPAADALLDLGAIHPEAAVFPCRMDEDADGRIWIGGENGLTLFDRERFVTTFTTDNSPLPADSVNTTDATLGEFGHAITLASGQLEEGNDFGNFQLATKTGAKFNDLNAYDLEQADKIDIRQLVFPARLRELGRWLIRSEISGQVPFEITYFTSGLSWRAFYMALSSSLKMSSSLV